MQLETFHYDRRDGWSVKQMPTLDSEATLLIAFGGRSFGDGDEALRELVSAFPRSHHIGCSTSGEIHDMEIADESLTVAVIRFDNTRLATAMTEVRSSANSFEAARKIARQLDAPDLRGVFVLSDGLSVNGTELVRGLNSVLASNVTITGGLAGDGDRFQRTWVLKRGVPSAHMITAVGFYGDKIMIGHGSRGGWDIFGPERTVTRSSGNVLFELDGRPALQLYKEYLGERAVGLPATGLLFPLSLRRDEHDTNSVVRTILAVDEREQSMTFAGDIPQGSRVQLMRANFDRLVDGASLAATMAGEDHAGPGDVLAIAISCVGRRLVLGDRAEEEIEATLEALPRGAKQIGFYSYGEISPFASGACDLHNQTMTMTTIREG